MCSALGVVGLLVFACADDVMRYDELGRLGAGLCFQKCFGIWYFLLSLLLLSSNSNQLHYVVRSSFLKNRCDWKSNI